MIATTVDFCEEQDTKMHLNYLKLLTVMAYGALGSIAVLIAVVAFWLLYPYDVLTLTPEVHPLVNDQRVVIQGESFAYTFAYDKKMAVPGVVSRYFVDGLRFQAEGNAPVLPEGKGVAVIEVDVPHTLPPGRYSLEISKSYKVNPLRTITIVNRTEKFLVIEPVRQR
jgi:hypothetical protein